MCSVRCCAGAHAFGETSIRTSVHRGTRSIWIVVTIPGGVNCEPLEQLFSFNSSILSLHRSVHVYCLLLGNSAFSIRIGRCERIVLVALTFTISPNRSTSHCIAGPYTSGRRELTGPCCTSHDPPTGGSDLALEAYGPIVLSRSALTHANPVLYFSQISFSL